MTRALLLAALLLLLSQDAVAARRSHARTRHPPPAAAPAQPPVVPVSNGPVGALLQPLVEDPLFTDAVMGFQVVNIRTGDEVFGWQADRQLQPASVTKLLTTAAALRTLGPAYHFGTDLLTDKDAQITPDGVLKGNLYVRGGADPTLVVEKLWRMVADLQMAGVSSIEGNVVFDASFFDDDPIIPGWDKDVDAQNGPSYFAPISALSVNFNTACLVIAPGPGVGKQAKVSVDTPVSVIEIDNDLVTGRAGSRRWVRVDREVEDDKITVKYSLKGNIPADDPPDREYRTIAAPVPYFMSVFRGVLDDRRLKVKGGFVEGVTPRDATGLVHMDSPPLAQILADMNKHSSNFMAETVLRTMGAYVHGAPGDTAKGLQVVNDYLANIGLPASSHTLVNGSGLSRMTAVPASVINAVVMDMYNDHAVGPEFLSSLSIGGVDGTLWARFRDDGMVGRIRGKTGSLNNVFCLAGVVDAGDGEVYAFALLGNELSASAWPVKRVLQRFAEIMMAAQPPTEPAPRAVGVR